MNTYKPIVDTLINRYHYLIDNGYISDGLPTNMSFGDLIDYVNKHLYPQLETKLRDALSTSNEATFRRLVLDTTFKILDDNEFINGDMRTVFEKEFN